MNTKDYIKVTKGGRSHILLAGNKAFYQSQGYTITDPTQEEVLKAFPELVKKETRESASQQNELEELKNANADLTKENEELKAENESLKAENESLKGGENAEELAEARKAADALQESNEKLLKENEELKAQVEELKKAAAKKSTTKTTAK